MLKAEDRQVIDFIERFNQGTTEQLYKLFYKSSLSFRGCQYRLKVLTEKNYLKRMRNFLTGEYTYFIEKPPKQADHNHYRNEVYIRLKQHYKVPVFNPKYQLDGITPDAYFEIEIRPHYFIMYYLEVQLSNSFDQDKYEKYYGSGKWRQITPVFPRVLVVSYKPVIFQPSSIKYQYTDLDLDSLFALIER